MFPISIPESFRIPSYAMFFFSSDWQHLHSSLVLELTFFIVFSNHTIFLDSYLGFVFVLFFAPESICIIEIHHQLSLACKSCLPFFDLQ